jgi:nitrate reductase gamma subunit
MALDWLVYPYMVILVIIAQLSRIKPASEWKTKSKQRIDNKLCRFAEDLA